MSQVGDIKEQVDRPAYVRFERRAVENAAKTREAGYSVSDDVDYALITPPYSKDLVERKVERWFLTTEQNVRAGRTPQKYLDAWKDMYERWKNGQDLPLDGTPIKEWSAVSPAQIKNIIAIGILTVEDLALANDQGVSRLGMGGQELKRKAKNWLDAAKDHGPLALKVTQLETDNSRLQLANDDLISKNKALMSQLEASSQPIHAETPQPMVQPEKISASDILDTTDEITDNTNISPPTVDLSLNEQYQAKFGKPPHHRMKESTIRQKLME